MRVYVEKVNDRWAGVCFAVSTEYSDGYLYKATSAKEAANKFCTEHKVKADKIMVMKNGRYKEA